MRPRFILAGALLLVHPAAAPAQTVWDMSTEYSQTTMPGLGVTTFAQRLAELSAGQIRIKPSFDASAGIRSAGMLAAVAEGRVQAGDAFAGALESEDPIFALPSLPFLVTSIADAKRLAYLARPFLAAALQRKGQRLLYLTPWPPSGIWSKAPLKTPSDLSSLAIRAYDKTSSEVLGRAGATATLISTPTPCRNSPMEASMRCCRPGMAALAAGYGNSCPISARLPIRCRSPSRL